MMDRVRMLSGGTVGVEYIHVEEGGLVYMTDITRRVKIESLKR